MAKTSSPKVSGPATPAQQSKPTTPVRTPTPVIRPPAQPGQPRPGPLHERKDSEKIGKVIADNKEKPKDPPPIWTGQRNKPE